MFCIYWLSVLLCALHQGQNALALDGEVTLPEPEKKWWQGDFHCNVAAKIDNLTELSALLLPESHLCGGTRDDRWLGARAGRESDLAVVLHVLR